MSNRRDIETQLASLKEIKEIMNAMKNLSLMEIHKLAHFLASQRKVVDSIVAAAADFLPFYPTQLPGVEKSRELYLLVGSERGFCGDFNDALIRAFENRSAAAPQNSVVVVGGKLAAKLGKDARLRAAIDGASVVEEVDAVLVKLTQVLTGPSASGASAGPLGLTVLHHQPEEDQVAVTVLQPLQPTSAKSNSYPHAPLLYLQPQSFLSGLIEQYLFAALHELLYSSLMAENQRRMQQMELAARRLEKTYAELMRKRNVLRQEEITEEIEVIMLSVKVLE
jgi:F-type H+-transporting ATPase subunit gamma